MEKAKGKQKEGPHLFLILSDLKGGGGEEERVG